MLKINNLTASVVLTTLFFAHTAYTADFSHKKQLNAVSKSTGFNVSEVELLSYGKGNGRWTTLENVLSACGESLVVSREKEDIEIENEYTTIAGDGWHLTVWGDGSKVEMMNHGYFETKKLEIKNEKSKYADSKISMERLEAIGRKFIESHLAEFVPLGKSEAYVPFHSVYELDGETDSLGNVKEEIVASIIVFSRTIDDVDVVGGGSKISIMFANDETPVGFRLDWPKYERTALHQNVLGSTLVKERLSGLSKIKSYMKNASLSRMECGYYDPGEGLRDSDAYIQSACYTFYQGDLLKGETQQDVAIAEVIPMGETVEMDSEWPETGRFFENGDVCSESDITPTVID
jgi:hypothetical protein